MNVALELWMGDPVTAAMCRGRRYTLFTRAYTVVRPKRSAFAASSGVRRSRSAAMTSRSGCGSPMSTSHGSVARCCEGCRTTVGERPAEHLQFSSDAQQALRRRGFRCVHDHESAHQPPVTRRHEHRNPSCTSLRRVLILIGAVAALLTVTGLTPHRWATRWLPSLARRCRGSCETCCRRGWPA